MYMRTPKMFGRDMKKVKEYDHFVLFVDEKTGIRECFKYWDLTHIRINGTTYMFDEEGNQKPIPEFHSSIPKQKIKNDLRLNEIIEGFDKGDLYEEFAKMFC